MSDIILGILLGIGVTFLLMYLYVRGLINQIIKDIDHHVEQAKETLMPITVERVNGEIYCYDKDKQFICQGKTATEIRDIIQKRFPEKTAFLDGGDEELVNELRNELRALKETL